MRRLTIVLALFAAGCGTTPAGPTPTPSTRTVTGQLTATNGGQAIPGAAVRFSDGTTTTTGPDGRFAAQITGSLLRVIFSGPLVQREVSSSGSVIDADGFVEDGSFDLTYYRQLVRGSLDNAQLQPVRRWTQNPRVYVRTVDQAGAAIDSATVAMTTQTIADTVPLMTGGTLTAVVESGTDTREGQAGWITVTWTTGTSGACGRASVGGSVIEMFPQIGCSCFAMPSAPRTVRHELAHILGAWHTDRPDDLMNPQAGCDRLPSAREQQYAAYLYRRPVGNLDLDADQP